MFNEDTIKQIFAGVLIAILFVFAFLILKPLFYSILIGLILAYIFNPANKWLLSKIKQPTVTAFITCTVVLSSLLALGWVLMPIFTKELIQGYSLIQSFDLVGILKKLFPFLFLSEQSTENFATAYTNLISNIVKSTIGSITSIITNFTSIVLKVLVVLIAFFYGLRDGDKLIEAIKDSLPFNKSITNRFIAKSKIVTDSIIYGRVIVGIITGILTGIGFYIFGVPGVLVLTFLAAFFSIIPLIGPWAVWIPVAITLFIQGKVSTAILLAIYGTVVVALFENVSYPLFVSKKAQLPTSLTLIGLIGGMLVFGIFGIILGPLIIAYLSVLFEIYRESNIKKT